MSSCDLGRLIDTVMVVSAAATLSTGAEEGRGTELTVVPPAGRRTNTVEDGGSGALLASSNLN